MIVKVEVGVMQPQTQGWHWKLEALGKVCPRCLRSSACPRLDLRLLVSRTGREQTPVVLSPLFVVIYSGRSRTLYSCLPPRFLIFSVGSVAQSCPTLGDPMDCSPQGSSVHGIFQAKVLEWDAIAFSISISPFFWFLPTFASLLFITVQAM